MSIASRRVVLLGTENADFHNNKEKLDELVGDKNFVYSPARVNYRTQRYTNSPEYSYSQAPGATIWKDPGDFGYDERLDGDLIAEDAPYLHRFIPPSAIKPSDIVVPFGNDEVTYPSWYAGHNVEGMEMRDHDDWAQHIGRNNLYNSDFRIMTLPEAIRLSGEHFIKPYHYQKLFNGGVRTQARRVELLDSLQRQRRYTPGTPDPRNLKVVVASDKLHGGFARPESRLVYIDRKPVSADWRRRRGLENREWHDRAKKFVDSWKQKVPYPNFSVDVVHDINGPKVMEFNPWNAVHAMTDTSAVRAAAIKWARKHGKTVAELQAERGPAPKLNPELGKMKKTEAGFCIGPER